VLFHTAKRCADVTTPGRGHSRSALHTVTRLTWGRRYSPFVVDRSYALGDNCVIEATPELVEHILSKIKFDAAAASMTYHASIPFSEISIGEQIGAGASKTVYAGTWVGNTRPQSVCVAHHNTITSLTLTPTELDIIRAIGKHPNLLRFYAVACMWRKPTS
jgi:hypothetical protein